MINGLARMEEVLDDNRCARLIFGGVIGMLSILLITFGALIINAATFAVSVFIAAFMCFIGVIGIALSLAIIIDDLG